MRYPRNAKIFRGGVDAAPFAGLFFIVLLFMMLFGWHVFIPGVRVKLSDDLSAPELTGRTVRVLRSGLVYFQGEEYELGGLKAQLRDMAQKGTLPDRVLFQAEPGASGIRVEETENAIKDFGITIKLPGSRMEIPEEGGFAGSPLRTVIVGMNLNGQVFYQHQRVPDELLEEKLRVAVREAGEPVAMVLQADKKVPYEKIVRLSNIARRAGVAELVLETRPGG